MKFRKVFVIGLLGAFLSPLALADVGHASPGHAPVKQDGSYGSVPQTTLPSSAAPVVKPAAQGKTRAEVRQELLQAYKDGLIPTTEADYPPSKRTIERNKALFAETERYLE
ncbi:DUF4148 domain-containing protein [Paraburkholderia phytofirmans]|uniref:DUF4148 domain-containing protein n=1 Tax=Paraburkholderia phytofirmans (strain DSM 17436 / LMG 22146 / PsJN) TaxID=398527 RepID=B2TF91_PARPJ|nr:DUF4148 domain-containing protein [Paraburkholderia phytofirmans]ACD18762.1 hypothetical protein Bphyt_4385 [Paraburkholderia phytofirmans PsJN]